MFRSVRGVVRLGLAVAYLLGVALRMHLGFARLPFDERQRRVQHWSAGVLRCLGMRLVVHGHMRPGARLVVANHISWLDIMAVNAVETCRFVSKSEVRDWPVVGRMVTLAGTIYLERARKRDALRVLGLVAQTLKDGHAAAVFPEGTTTDGHTLLPFHANLLQSAIDADVPVQPLALRYSDAKQVISPAAAYVGDTTLLQSLWWVACAEDLTVTVRVLPPVRVTHADRRALADSLREQIRTALEPGPEREQA